jgi:hypothetical protein
MPHHSDDHDHAGRGLFSKQTFKNKRYRPLKWFLVIGGRTACAGGSSHYRRYSIGGERVITNHCRYIASRCRTLANGEWLAPANNLFVRPSFEASPWSGLGRPW